MIERTAVGQVLRCPRCNDIVAEVAWQGRERTRCRNRRCGKRLLIVSDGKEVRVTQVDTPLKRVKMAAT